MAACDQPGTSYPLPPGRSGTEFIARLVELEHFAGSHPAFSDEYSGFHEEDAADLKVGKIEERNKFLVQERFSPVNPYRSLDADRLKLSGTGEWDLQEHLDSSLWLPFQEPGVLYHGIKEVAEGPNFSFESRDENLKLARLWDSRGLAAMFMAPHHSGLACRVFNAHKSSTIDRQIGDRRWFNSSERHPSGPSARLPSGCQITSIHCGRGCKLVGCASDRKDFYHQAKVSRERAWSNILPFSFKVDEINSPVAFAELAKEVSAKTTREEHGDRYGLGKRKRIKPESIEDIWIGFKSLYQGDHLGVEFALESHHNMLRDGGLLCDDCTIYNHAPCPTGPVWEGLVIDDWFCISKESESTPTPEAASVKRLAVAERIYAENGVLGSDEKTIRGAETFKVVGAEIIADHQTRSSGLVSVAAPLAKRLPMTVLSFRVAALPVITRSLASRLAGNWVSILMYRRCLCCILSKIFALGTRGSSDGGDVVRLPRNVADELVLSGIFSLCAASDISVPYDDWIYATDASNIRGAVTQKYVGEQISSALWLGGDKKGAYVMLDNPARAQRRGLGVDCDDEFSITDFPGPLKTLEFAFDFVEIYGGSGSLSAAASALGLSVCTPIDISGSKHYDMRNPKLIDWIFQMLHEKRFRSIACEPPCTTFSIAQHPPSRSHKQPLGFCRTDPKTFLGNLLAFKSFAILWFAWRCSAPSLLETPHLSKLAWLDFWAFLKSIGFEEAILNSCALGSIHKKAFRLLGWKLNMQELQIPCPGNHQHVKIEGKLTAASAVYHPNVAKKIAEQFAAALKAKDDEEHLPQKTKLESVVINDLLCQGGWETLAAWDWKQTGHINVLESRAFVGLAKNLVDKGGDRRFTALLDSRVAKGAHGKGRSSSFAMTPSLQKAASYFIAGNLHPSLGFAPTRLNTADAPTRLRELPQSAFHSVIDFLSSSEISSLHAHQFSRASANWIRLYLLVVIIMCPGVDCRLDGFRSSDTLESSWRVILGFFLACLLLSPGLFACLDGFLHPWTFLPSGALCYNICNPKYISTSQIHLAAISISLLPCHAMPLLPTNRDEADRAARRSGTTLQADRVVLQSTRNRRDQLLTSFDSWLVENFRTTLERLLEPASLDAEQVSETLVAYGKDLYVSGKSYGRFSETINAITARRPTLRRQLASCWDLAFNWVVDEPHEHHTALPQAILVALVSLSLLWGWAREAAIWAITWAGVLRIGEVLAARREDLILPRDAAPGCFYIILKIKLPKTRGRAARHQSARIEPEDLVQLIDAVFAGLTPTEPLWNMSPSALRKRFNILQSSLGLGTGNRRDEFPYSLSSLRPGGATYWLQATEDAEYVRRKGRWVSTRVLEIYLQESVFATYTQKMTRESQSRVADLCDGFQDILQKTIYFKRHQIPECAWPRLW